jgi:hypothetical protein
MFPMTTIIIYHSKGKEKKSDIKRKERNFIFNLFLLVNNQHQKEMMMLILERLFLVYLVDETDLIYDDHPILKKILDTFTV